MDRWSDRDNFGEDPAPKGPAGNVAKFGMGGFIRSGAEMGTSAATVTGKIEIVNSRREQKKEQARKQMPPPPAAPAAPGGGAQARGGPAGAPGPSAFPPPPWAGVPPQGYHLECSKEGQIVQHLPLERAAHLFGRGAAADVVLEHQSISRQHAALCYNVDRGIWQVLDLGATHGTFVDGRPVVKGGSADLRIGREVRFGASTRSYVLRRTEADVSSGDGKRKRGVQWPDEIPPDSKRDRPALAQVIGYSDGRDFAVGVGPSPVASQSEGRFADLVQQVVIRKAPTPAQREKHPGPAPASFTPPEAGDASEARPDLPKKARAISPRTKARLSADALRMYGARQGMYGALPPAKEKTEEMAGLAGEQGIEPPPSAGLRTLYDFLPPARDKNLHEEAQPGIESHTSAVTGSASLLNHTKRNGGGTSAGRDWDGMGVGAGASNGRDHEGSNGIGIAHQGTPVVPTSANGDGEDDMFAANSEGPT